VSPLQWVAIGVLGALAVWRLVRLVKRENQDPLMGSRFSWPPTLPQLRAGLAVVAAGAGYILIVTSSGTGRFGLAAGIALFVGSIVVMAVWGRSSGRSA